VLTEAQVECLPLLLKCNILTTIAKNMCKCVNMFIVASVSHYSSRLTCCCRKACFQTSSKRVRNTSQGTEVTSITTACHPSRKECQLDIPMRCQTCAVKDKVQGVLDHGNRDNLSYIILYRRWL